MASVLNLDSRIAGTNLEEISASSSTTRTSPAISGRLEFIVGLEKSSFSFSQEANSDSFTETVVVEGDMMVQTLPDMPRTCVPESMGMLVESDARESSFFEGDAMKENIRFHMAPVLDEGTGFEGKKKSLWSPEQEFVEKEEKLSRRESVEASIKDYEFNFPVVESRGEAGMGLRRRYSRIELEALRFVNVGEQKQRWDDLLRGLEPVVSREYNELSASNHQKKACRSDNQGKNVGKNKASSVSHDALFIKNKEKVLDLMEPLELFSGDMINGNKDWTVAVLAEEPCNEDDSDAEYYSIQRAAFFVEGEPDFESGPPQDGLEYLRRVRWEAAQIPKVKVAKLDRSVCFSEQTPYMPNIPDIAKCPENLSPLKHWEDAFLSEFSELREAFLRLENSNDQSSITSADKDICEESSGLKHQKNIPTVTTILGLDAVSRAAMLRKRINTSENAGALSRDSCLWIFALSVAVDTPLNAEMSACFRCLLRKCSCLLAEKTELDDEVAMLNILIVISGKYFGQSESTM